VDGLICINCKCCILSAPQQNQGFLCCRCLLHAITTSPPKQICVLLQPGGSEGLFTAPLSSPCVTWKATEIPPIASRASGSALGRPRLPRGSRGFEHPISRIWFRPLIIRLVIPEGDRDSDRSAIRYLTGHGIPASASKRLNGDFGVADCDVRLRQPVIDLTIDCEPVCAGEGLDLHRPAPKRSPGITLPRLSLLCMQSTLKG
jgi:hypothetical protein